MPNSIKTYDGLNAASLNELAGDIEDALNQASLTSVNELDEEDSGPTDSFLIQPFEDLIGIDPSVYRQINAALKAGLRHIMLYGPPGTGKTTIAQRIAGAISERWKLVTGSADWTSQEIVGGYHPLSDGKLMFQPGVLLEHFDKPVIFDELNRCDIDKVIGPLFTVLSGQGTTLPYLSDPSNPQSPRIQILPKGISEPPFQYAPTTSWRIIATINSIDKASLYQMSYALTRRFAWIFVPIPQDTSNFVQKFIGTVGETEQASVPLGEIWAEVNRIREIGAAPVIDMIRVIRATNESFDFRAKATADTAVAYLDALEVCLLPMLDGILREEGERLSDALGTILQSGGVELSSRLKGRVMERTI